MCHDGTDGCSSVVAQAQADHTVPLDLVDRVGKCVPLYSRLRVLLFVVVARCHDLYCLDDSSGQRDCQFLVRSDGLQ